MTYEEIKTIEDKCIIKSREQFIECCQKNGIKSEWYGFVNDRSRPVCIFGGTVTYGKIGQTICHVEMCVYDVAFAELIKYKEKFEWEQKKEVYKVTSIVPKTNEIIATKQPEELIYPYVRIVTMTTTNTPDINLLRDGWEDGGFDSYNYTYSYYKTVDIKSILSSIEIQFNKMTDERDKEEFAFDEEYMLAGCRYPIPEDLLEDIAKRVYEKKSLTTSMWNEILKRYESKLVEDEYIALKEYRDNIKETILRIKKNTRGGFDIKKLCVNAVNRIESPAYIPVYGSRGSVIRSGMLGDVK